MSTTRTIGPFTLWRNSWTAGGGETIHRVQIGIRQRWITFTWAFAVELS